MSERPILLTGFMGSGKSTVGRVVAEQLGYQFVDLDEAIVAQAGTPVTAIFAQQGEVEFRRLEQQTLREILASDKRVVIATGGGVVISPENRAMMRRSGIVVNLRVSAEQVLERLQGTSDRPLLTGDNMGGRAAALLAEREQFYADADIRIDTNSKSVEDVSAEILRMLKGFSA